MSFRRASLLRPISIKSETDDFSVEQRDGDSFFGYYRATESDRLALQHAMVSDDDSLGSGAKRRRLRKGTHSCWECKRRKVRCSFESSAEETCIPCRRRGVKCVGQDLPEELSQTEDGNSRMVRVESLLNELVKKVDHGGDKDRARSTSKEGQRPATFAPTPGSSFESTPCSSCNSSSPEKTPRENGASGACLSTIASSLPSSQTRQFARVEQPNGVKYEKVSKALLAAFPSQGDIDILLKICCTMPILCSHLRRQLDSRIPVKFRHLDRVPSFNTHPVLLARQMLIYASLLLYMSAHENIHRLSENHRVIRERLADAAISLVTTSEELFGTMESLECIIYEGFYHLDYGNIRRGWLAFRRAMGAAQLMGIDRPRSPSVKIIDPCTDVNPQAIWFRIVHMDRFLSLLLGLAPGNSDLSVQPPITLASSDPTLQLEAVHAVISAKILERNRLDMSEHALAVTLEIDKELLKTANGLPAAFWEPASFTGLNQGSHEAFLETTRIRDQVFHYTLLNQLHLPFLLCPSADGKNEYSRITCVNASREVLTRFFVFRSFNTMSACCRLADFLALVAGMTLILAHVDSHCHGERANLLAHQRLGDRATVEQALATMQINSKLNEDMLAARCAELLKRLLEIEADAASHGQLYSSRDARETEEPTADRANVLLIAVPYRGTVKISRRGVGFLGPNTKTSRFTQDLGTGVTIGGLGSVNVASSVVADGVTQQLETVPSSCANQNDREIRNPAPPLQNAPAADPDGPALQESMHDVGGTFASDIGQQQALFPGVAADMNDWVFQGIDTAFFDSLIRESGAEISDEGGVVDWSQSGNADWTGL